MFHKFLSSCIQSVLIICCLSSGSSYNALASDDEYDPTRSIYQSRSGVGMPPTLEPPLIDGLLSQDEWKNATAFTGFYEYETGYLLSRGPVAMLSYSQDQLYCLVLTPQPEDRKLSSRTNQRDGDVYKDDSIEFYLKPTKAESNYHFIVNHSGVIADYKDDNPIWNGHFDIKTGEISAADLPAEWGLNSEKYWLAEFSIRMKEIEIDPTKLEQGLGLNIAVNRQGPWAVSSPLAKSTFNQHEKYMNVDFLSPEEPYVRITSLGDPSRGSALLTGVLRNPGRSPLKARLELDLRKKESHLTKDAYRNIIGIIHAQQRDINIAPGGEEPIKLEKSGLEPEVNLIGYRFTNRNEKQDVLNSHHGPLKVNPLLSSAFLTVPSKSYAVLSLDTVGMQDLIKEKSVSFIVSVTDQQQRTFKKQQVSAIIGKSHHRIDYQDFPEGEYQVLLTTLPGSEVELKQEHQLTIPHKPDWQTSSLYDELGTRKTVPKPWEPVTYGHQKINVWGREYTWNENSLLPSQITSVGTKLLSSPMQIVATIDGTQHTVPLDKFVYQEQSDKRGAFRATGTIQGINVTADMWIEYDGFLWVDLKTEDNQANRNIDSLHVEVKMPTSAVPLYQTFDASKAGYIGTEPIQMGWAGSGNIVNFYHWLGNEDKGLGFTYTSLEHWTPESQKAFCTIEPGKETTTYTIHLADKSTQLNGRLYQFGVQATPIKPLRPDYHAMMATTLELTPWKAWLNFSENVDVSLVWPHPNSKIMMSLNDPYQVDQQLMKEQVKRAHEKSVPMLSVASCPQKFTLMDKSARYHQLEWQVLPESKLNWEGVPNIQNCANSYSLRKWLFYGWAIENVQKLGLDGIYYDGWQGGQIACSNPHHGCGWVDEDGNRQSTVPVLAGREYNQRIIQYLEENVDSEYVFPANAPELSRFPRYHYWIHSWQFVPSVMGFATSWLTGEFTGWPHKGVSTLDPKGTFGTSMGLGRMRVLGLSTNWGVPNLFLPLMWEHTKDHEKDNQTLMAYAWLLPHGAPIADLKYMNQKTVTEITKLLMDFGVRHSTFTPGWRKNPYLKITSSLEPQTMVATWASKKDNKVLAVVSNLTVGESRKLKLKLASPNKFFIFNARTNQAISTNDGTFNIELAAESFVLLRLEPKS